MARILKFERPESPMDRWQQASRCVLLGRRNEALDILEGLVAEGYLDAYLEIGNIYESDGGGVAQDLDMARRWYMRAIDDGEDDYAYLGLARLVLNGHADAGTPSDAVDYLRVACKADNPMAMTLLGTLYHAGNLVAKDLDQAAELYTNAAEQGYVLPLLYLSKVKLEQRHYSAWLRLRLKTMARAYRLARQDRYDSRLWSYLPPWFFIWYNKLFSKK